MEAVQDLTWTPEQERALESVAAWMRNPDKGSRTPYLYRLFGFAGTGKTTLAKHFAQDLDGQVLFAAYTGKASDVLAAKGCPNPTTVHKLIYSPAPKSPERMKQMQVELEQLEILLATERNLTPEQIRKHPEVMKLENEIALELKSLKRPSWKLNADSEIADARLIVLDECSMIDERMGVDLMGFNVPILVLGDPFQLPPLYGEGFFTKDQPDILLTDVKRQAKDNPVLQMATLIREGKELRHGSYGNSKVITKAQVVRDEIMAADQVLVGLNKTRRNYNFRMRQLLGRNDPMPVLGDKLVCLRNNSESGIRNGSLWRVKEAMQSDPETLELVLTSDNGKSDIFCTAHAEYFRGNEPPHWEIRDKDCFDYGYNITVHKSQGSQWDNVYIFDESYAFRKDARRWLYTAVTRAAKQTTVVM